MWFIYGLLCLIAAVILLLCIPVEFALSLNTQETPRLRASYKWWFGIIKGDINKRYPAKKRVKKQKKPARVNLFEVFIEIISRKGLLKQIFLFLRRNFESVKIKELAGEVEIGLDDPINNAWLFAFEVPLNYLLLRKAFRLKIKPVFSTDYYFSCNLRATIRVFPIQLIGNVLQFVFSAPGWGLSWTMARRRWKKMK